jgi:hypothetical protein
MRRLVKLIQSNVKNCFREIVFIKQIASVKQKQEARRKAKIKLNFKRGKHDFFLPQT